MADGEYRRLTCKVDACDGNHKAHGYCIRHYRQWQRGGIRADASQCAHCEQPFQPTHVGTIYCTKRCKRAAWVKANPERYKASPSMQPKVCAVYAGYCERCGAAFTARRRRKYCTGRCGAKPLTRPARPCKWCASLFVPAGTAKRPTAYCCDECRREGYARARKLGADRREVRIRKARRPKHPSTVDPIKVFTRDRWRCKMCGRYTPPEKRGTCEPDAPELDHILPVSRGGEHSYRNTRCACRQCNGAKSDRLVYLPPRRRSTRRARP